MDWGDTDISDSGEESHNTNDTTITPQVQFKEILSRLSTHHSSLDAPTNLAQWAAKLEIESRTLQQALKADMNELKSMMVAFTAKMAANDKRHQQLELHFNSVKQSITRIEKDIGIVKEAIQTHSSAPKTSLKKSASSPKQITSSKQKSNNQNKWSFDPSSASQVSYEPVELTFKRK